MKTLLIIAVLTFSSFRWPGGTGFKFKQQDDRLRLGIRISCLDTVGACEDFNLTATVTIYNGTDSLISIFRPEYLWGYFNTSFLVEGTDTNYKVIPKDRDFNKNIPAYVTLFPGDSMIVANKVKLTRDFSWQPYFPYINVKNIKSIKAIYRYALDTASIEVVDALDDLVKYKYEFRSNSPLSSRTARNNGFWLKTDSIPNPVPLRRTFLFEKLESETVEVK